MNDTVFFISEGRMYMCRNKNAVEIESGVLKNYRDKVLESAKRTEWKKTGSGAAFTNGFEQDADPESRVSAVRSYVRCLGLQGGNLIYSINVDGTVGVYRKYKPSDANEGIVVSSGEYAYNDFDTDGKRFILSAAFAGESHIALLDPETGDCDVLTDGPSWDYSPVFSASGENAVYFCSAGLELKNTDEPSRPEKPGKNITLPEIWASINAVPDSTLRGPATVCRLGLDDMSMNEVVAADGYDCVRPQSMPDGSLYYIKKPYDKRGAVSPAKNALGCLLDIVLFPVRLIMALFGFLNFFSMRYSGKNLKNSGDVRQRDEKQVFIDGNLINAEKERKQNRARGEKEPGIIPRSWELHRRKPDGSDELVRRGVVAFRADQNGELLFSNGSAVILRRSDGSEEKVCSTSGVTFIY